MGTGNPPGRPKLPPEKVLREHITIRVKPGATKMLRSVAAQTGESFTGVVRRYISEGLSREAELHSD
jgi:hypothetical protein